MLKEMIIYCNDNTVFSVGGTVMRWSGGGGAHMENGLYDWQMSVILFAHERTRNDPSALGNSESHCGDSVAF